MDDFLDFDLHDNSKPRWENMVESPILEPITSKYKLKLKYGGYFRLAKNSRKKRYCFGFQKSIFMDTCSYTLEDLNEEVRNRYASKRDSPFFILFIDKYAEDQSFIMLDSEENFKVMLSMYEKEKEVTIFVTTDNTNLEDNELQKRGQDEVISEHEDDDSDNCPSEESYHSHLSSDIEDERLNCEGETYSNVKKTSIMKANSRFSNVIDFRRALNHHAITNEFDYFIEKSEPTRFTARCANIDCGWKIHACRMEDGVTFQVKKLVEEHSCIRSNRGGNRRATQGWIADILSDKLKSDGDASVPDLTKWILKTYNVELPYHKVFRGKEQAYTDIYGKWEDSFVMIDNFKEELLARDPRSVVDIEFEKDGDKKRFMRFFISFTACSTGFLVGCHPYISLDACHLKGKFNGVLAAATGIDGNNSIFPVAYGVLESENTKSWTWFLELLKKAIGTPYGLVISSDMQKGLEAAITQVYPNIEHRECIRHLYSNFRRHFRGDFFYFKLWGAAIAYCVNDHDRLLDEIAAVRKEAITYLSENHNKIWSRCKFGTKAKCDYITNNISEGFNSWIGDLRYRPVLDLLDGIREKLMKRFDKKRSIVKKWKGSLVPKAKSYVSNITKNLGGYEVSRSSDNRAEVTYKGKRYEVTLDEKKCSCRVWQVKGLPCVHAAAFITSIRDDNWEKYVDPYFTVDNYKKAYALEITTIPTKDQWVQIETQEMIHPPTIKRPPGRPRKNRIVPHDEPKKRHRCQRCSEYGHHAKKCKNSASQSSNQCRMSTSKRGRDKKV